MQTTIQIKLLPTKEQENLIKATLMEYINAVNRIVSDFVAVDTALKISSKDVFFQLPSALRGQVVLDCKSIFKKYKKACRKADSWNKKHPTDIHKVVKVPILRKPMAIWNNQNHKINEGVVNFPVFINGKSQRINVKALIPVDTLDRIENNKLGTFRITIKSGKVIGQIAIENNIAEPSGTGVMGVDLGLKIPAVAVTDTGNVKFVGNGRQNKYIRRKYRAKRKALGKAKKLNAIRKNDNKEQRIMRDIDHKLSREIVNFAVNNSVGTIKLEQLANIRKTAKTSRKNEKNLHTWSFYRLAQYIEYKAKLMGIEVQYVNPSYTSQICPLCGAKNHAEDRKYKCSCGFHGHRDIVGATNIIKVVPVIDGNSLSA